MERFNLRHSNVNGVHKLPLMLHDNSFAWKSSSTKDKTTIIYNYMSEVNVSGGHYLVLKLRFVPLINQRDVYLLKFIFLIAIWHFSSIKHPLWLYLVSRGFSIKCSCASNVLWHILCYLSKRLRLCIVSQAGKCKRNTLN